MPTGAGAAAQRRQRVFGDGGPPGARLPAAPGAAVLIEPAAAVAAGQGCGSSCRENERIKYKFSAAIELIYPLPYCKHAIEHGGGARAPAALPRGCAPLLLHGALGECGSLNRDPASHNVHLCLRTRVVGPLERVPVPNLPLPHRRALSLAFTATAHAAMFIGAYVGARPLGRPLPPLSHAPSQPGVPLHLLYAFARDAAHDGVFQFYGAPCIGG